MPPPILITGAAGFAGSHLVALLARDGAEIVAWRRTPPSTEPGTGPPTTAAAAERATPIRWEAVDLLDGPAVADAVARLRPEVVYHCAGAAHVGRSWNRTESTF